MVLPSFVSPLSWWLRLRTAPRVQEALPQCCGSCHQGRAPCPMPALCSGHDRTASTDAPPHRG